MRVNAEMPMPQAKDLYELLGVPRTATQDEIRKAYLKLAHKHHPDKTGGDKESETKLKEINAAYDVLKNPEKRAHYDRFGSADGQNPFGGGGGFGQGGEGFEAPFDDFFDMLFGQQGGRRGARRGPAGAQAGNDLELRLTLTLKEAAKGAKKKVRFNRNESCNDCNGTGAAAGSQAQTCPECGGAGQVRAAHGFFSVTRPCNRCGGAGKIISNPCGSCKGSGQVKQSREVSVDIPAGVDTGSQLRVTGEGEPGRGGGPRGDLYIAIKVQPDDRFRRDGTTILCEVPVSFTQAALGDTVRVPTITGEAELKVPAGTQTGSQFRLRGMGMPDLRGYGTGDQIVKIVVETPKKLSKRQKELLKEFQEISDQDTYPLYRRFMDTFFGD
jgi:molecular chaperone DnaJ